jgi:transcriptional regulator with XRE-family HTH domain
MKKAMETLSKLITDYRTKHGLSQADFGKKVGIAQSQIGHLETGENTPRLLTLQRLARTFHLTAREVGEIILKSKFPRSERRA